MIPLATGKSPTFPGKVILAGEHFVSHGGPAIAVPWHGGGLQLVPREADCPPDATLDAAWAEARGLCGLRPVRDLDFRVASSIPAGAGLGSSAALSVALVLRACLESGLDTYPRGVGALAARVENVFHGRSSGLDPMVVALDAPLYWSGPQRFDRLDWGLPGTILVVAVESTPRTTAEVVARVRESAARHHRRFRAQARAAAAIVARVRHAAGTGDILELGTSMTANHAILAYLGVSSPRLDAIVSAALRAGALGAKLSGAGLGGAVLAVCEPDRREAVRTAMAGAGAVVLPGMAWSANP